MTRHRTALRVALGVALGAAAWEAGVRTGAPVYVPAMLVAGALLGLWFGGHPLVTGAALAAPGLALAPWDAPRGDGDGLWLLVFPAIVWYGFLAAVAHWIAVAAWRWWSSR